MFKIAVDEFVDLLAQYRIPRKEEAYQEENVYRAVSELRWNDHVGAGELFWCLASLKGPILVNIPIFHVASDDYRAKYPEAGGCRSLVLFFSWDEGASTGIVQIQNWNLPEVTMDTLVKQESESATLADIFAGKMVRFNLDPPETQAREVGRPPRFWVHIQGVHGTSVRALEVVLNNIPIPNATDKRTPHMFIMTTASLTYLKTTYRIPQKNELLGPLSMGQWNQSPQAREFFWCENSKLKEVYINIPIIPHASGRFRDLYPEITSLQSLILMLKDRGADGMWDARLDERFIPLRVADTVLSPGKEYQQLLNLLSGDIQYIDFDPKDNTLQPVLRQWLFIQLRHGVKADGAPCMINEAAKSLTMSDEEIISRFSLLRAVRRSLSPPTLIEDFHKEYHIPLDRIHHCIGRMILAGHAVF